MPDLEQSLRTLFESEAEDTGPNAPIQLTLARRRRRYAIDPRPVAVVGMVLLVLVGTTAVLRATKDTAAPVDGPTHSITTPSGPVRLGDPDEGYRWVSWRGIAAQVPRDWGYDVNPVTACLSADPESPYVAIDTHGMPIPAIACPPPGPGGPIPGFGPLDPTSWVAHLSWHEVGEYGSDRVPTNGTLHHDGWTLTTRTFGDAQLRLLTAPGQDALRRRIVASVQQFDIDQNGCDAIAPTDGATTPTPPIDVRDVQEVSSIAVCLYIRDGHGNLLRGSRLLTGSSAADLLAAIKGAPGATLDPQVQCANGSDPVLALRLNRGNETPNDLYLSTKSGCAGITDGTRTIALTTSNCMPLFEAPIRLWSGSPDVYGACSNRR